MRQAFLTARQGVQPPPRLSRGPRGPGAFLGIFLGLASALVGGAAEEGRALWLTRWHARTSAEIVSCLDAMVSLSMNILFCQVYGDGYALYGSGFVPRSPLVSGDFDALDVAVREGHRRGIQVHAYINVCNVYSGGLGPPAGAQHLLRAHPGWAVVDSAGRSDAELVGVSGTLIFFCPEQEGFRRYCVDVAAEIAERYEVDGVHLDYLRLPGGAPRCFCGEHRRKFAELFGREPTHEDPDFVEFRYETIARLFADIHDTVSERAPRAAVSASLISPTGRYFQDAQRVLEAGKLDIAVPMIYTANADLFEEQARSFHEHSGGRLVLAGIGLEPAGEDVLAQVELARRVGLEGQAVFTFSTLDASARDQLAAAYSSAASPPAMPWRDGSRDRAAPVISGLRAAGILAEEATILWHTDERTRGRVEHGPTASLGSVAEETAFSFDHAVRLAALRPGSRYFFRVSAADLAGNETLSTILTFTTAASGPVVLVVDDGDEGFFKGGAWSAGSSPGGNDGDYLFSTARSEETAWAEFRPFLPIAGEYEVSVWYVAGSNRADDVAFTVRSSTGSARFAVNQKLGGGAWNRLGGFRFAEGESGFVRQSNRASGGDVVIADAVRFLLLKAEARFLRGDANVDGEVDISDAVAILGFLFLGGASPPCLDAADSNDSGVVDLSDAVYVLAWLFSGGPRPPEPFPAPATDPTEDALPPC